VTRCEHLRRVPFLAECRNRVDLTPCPLPQRTVEIRALQPMADGVAYG
jgi:hypothetical protein